MTMVEMGLEVEVLPLVLATVAFAWRYASDAFYL
jgi:hypothetical protein